MGALDLLLSLGLALGENKIPLRILSWTSVLLGLAAGALDLLWVLWTCCGCFGLAPHLVELT